MRHSGKEWCELERPQSRDVLLLPYLVHLDSSLCPLQCNGVGLLQPLRHSFLEPLVEIVEGQRPIPGDEGTNSLPCTATAWGHRPSLLSRSLKLHQGRGTQHHAKEKPFPCLEVELSIILAQRQA